MNENHEFKIGDVVKTKDLGDELFYIKEILPGIVLADGEEIPEIVLLKSDTRRSSTTIGRFKDLVPQEANRDINSIWE